MSLQRLDIFSTPPELDPSIPLIHYLSILNITSKHIHYLQEKSYNLLSDSNIQLKASSLSLNSTEMLKSAKDYLDMSMTLALRFCKALLFLLPQLPSHQRYIYRIWLRSLEQKASDYVDLLRIYNSDGAMGYWQAYYFHPVLPISSTLTNESLALSDAMSTIQPDPTQGFDEPSVLSLSQLVPDVTGSQQLMEEVTSSDCSSKTMSESSFVIPSIIITAHTPTWSTASMQSFSTSSTSSIASSIVPITSTSRGSSNNKILELSNSSVRNLIRRFSSSSEPETVDSNSVDMAIHQWRCKVPPIVSPSTLPITHSNLQNKDISNGNNVATSLGARFSAEKKLQNTTDFGVEKSLHRRVLMNDQMFSDIVEARTNMTLRRIFSKGSGHESVKDYRYDSEGTYGASDPIVLPLVDSLLEGSLIEPSRPIIDEIKKAKFTKEYKEDNEYTTLRNSRTARDFSLKKSSSTVEPIRLSSSPGSTCHNVVKSIVHRFNGAQAESLVYPLTESSSSTNYSLINITGKSTSSSTRSLVTNVGPFSPGRVAIQSRQCFDADYHQAHERSPDLKATIRQHTSQPDSSSSSFSLTNNNKATNDFSKFDAGETITNIKHYEQREEICSDDYYNGADSDVESLQYLDIDPAYDSDGWIQGSAESNINKNKVDDTLSPEVQPSHWKQPVQGNNASNGYHLNKRSNNSIRVADAIKSFESKNLLNHTPTRSQQLSSRSPKQFSMEKIDAKNEIILHSSSLPSEKTNIVSWNRSMLDFRKPSSVKHPAKVFSVVTKSIDNKLTISDSEVSESSELRKRSYQSQSTVLGTSETPILATAQTTLNVREARALIHERRLFRKLL
ncbi:hypothetical protein BGZ46_007945 [Entomortierella lignicola]|nr:hypothetical protein BGZ46_007945 [Entomortierella lignicola]